MPFRLAAYSESVDAADAENRITPVVDPTIAADGDFYRAPPDRNNVIGYGVLMSSGGTQRARLEAASILARLGGPLDIIPKINALVWGSPPEVSLFPRSPIPLVALEGVAMVQRSDPAAAERQYGLLWLASGAIEPVTGAIVSIRATASISLAAGAWVNGAITLAQTLPIGTYQVVGARFLGTNLVAARLVPTDVADRPGMAAVNAEGDLDHPLARFGGLGVWLTFMSLTPPTLDALGVTDTAQTLWLDLLRAG